MKKFLIIFCFILLFSIGIVPHFMFKAPVTTAMPNPWVDCQDDFACAKKVSGINFPLSLSNYWIRAMKGMVEISYPLDEFRNVTVRKVENYIGEDISGVYTHYKTNKKVKLKNGVVVDIRGNGRTIYVMNMSASGGYYSAYCEKGMSMKEVEGVYEVIKEAEAPRIDDNSQSSKYSFCELGDLVGKDVKRIKYRYYNIDYHSKEFKEKQVLKFAQECFFDGVVSQYQMDCCMSKKMYPNY